MNIHTKQCVDPVQYHREIEGYHFFRGYYDRIPALLGSDPDTLTVDYENIASSENHVVTDCMVADVPVDLSEAFLALSSMANAHATIREAGGGSKMFFFDRDNRLAEPSLSRTYSEFASANPQAWVNDANVPINPSLLDDLRTFMANATTGVCIPSQGDLHERNIFSRGDLIDFEASGWNLQSTDIATFVFHIMVCGNYFGPKYARWSTELDKLNLENSRQEVHLAEDHVSIHLNDARKSVLKQFMAGYVGELAHASDDVLRDASSMLSIRLLTVFNPLQMADPDAKIAFTLANYFADDQEPFVKKVDKFLQ